MKTLGLVLILWGFVSCNRSHNASSDPSTANSVGAVAPGAASVAAGGAGHPVARPNPIRDLVVDAGIDVSRLGSDAGFSTEDVDKLLEIVYGDRARHSKEELRVIAFVESYLDVDQPKYPRPRRFLVDREPDGWAVSVLTLEALKRMDRIGDLVVHVVEKNGKLRVARLTTRS